MVMLPRGWAALALLVVAAAPARAQVVSDRLGIERFRIATDRAGLLDVEWAGVPDHLTWSVGVLAGFAHDPLVVYDQQMDAVEAVVDGRVTTTLVGSLALWNRLAIGASLDVIGYQDGSTTLSMRSLPGGGLGDGRLVAKLQLVTTERWQVALVPALVIPGGDARGYLREAGIAFSPALAVAGTFGRLRGALNAGYHLKPRVETAGLVSDDEAFARIGAGLTLGDVDAPAAELWWSTSLATPIADRATNQVAVEMLAGGVRQLTSAVAVFAAGGVGLDNGFGTPGWRALAGVRFEQATGERDHDGIHGAADRCPLETEDRDGLQDDDGCPDPDNGDGVADAHDRCPEPEDKDGFQDGDGCPDLDDDGDGVADARDRCAQVAEDKDGFQDDDGCPDAIARLAGRVVDPDGRPIAGARVTITQTEAADAAPIQLTVGEDGAFATELHGGALAFTARAAEYQDGATQASVAPGTSGTVSIQLVRKIRQGQLRGQVLSFDGKPLAASITVRGKTTTTGATDAEGLFSMELPDGTFSVEITSPGYATQKRSVAIKLNGVTVLNVDLRSAK